MVWSEETLTCPSSPARSTGDRPWSGVRRHSPAHLHLDVVQETGHGLAEGEDETEQLGEADGHRVRNQLILEVGEIAQRLSYQNTHSWIVSSRSVADKYYLCR